MEKTVAGVISKHNNGAYSSGTVRDFHPIPFSSAASPMEAGGTKRCKDNLFYLNAGKKGLFFCKK
jgi:hypothetical protein